MNMHNLAQVSSARTGGVVLSSDNGVQKAFIDGKEVTPEEARRIGHQLKGAGFRKYFEKLPIEVQDEILGHIEVALLWKGWDKNNHGMGGGNHAKFEIQEIARILSEHGMEHEEYT